MNLEHLRDELLSEIPETFIGEPPAHTNESISLREWGGSAATEHFGQSTTMRRPHLLIVGRGKDFKPVQLRMQKAKELLNGYSAPEENILSIFARGDIQYLGKSEGDFHEFQLLFRLLTKE